MTLAVGCGHEIVRDDALNLKAMNEIAAATSATRELDIVETVQANVLSKDEVKAYFEQRYSGEMPWLDTDTKVAHKLGILPAHIHLRDLYKRSYTRNAAALYERKWCYDDDDDDATPCLPQPGRMRIFSQKFPRLLSWPIDAMGIATGTDWIYGLIVSHELVHALQDQHFGLAEVLPSSLYAENEDAALARKSVIESEANVVSYAFLFGMDLQSGPQRNLLIEYLLSTRYLSEGLALIANRKSPGFYTKVLTAQYFDGMRFLQRTANAGGGYHAVNLAYERALPESTEQILHPEKLFGDAYDPPRTFPPLTKEILPGWTHLDDNTLGELRLRALLEDAVGGVRAASVAAGWGGDRYDVLEKGPSAAGAEGGRVLLSWRLAFDSPEDAVEMTRAWRRVLHDKYPERLSSRTGALIPDGWTLLRVEPRMPEGGPMPGVPTAEVEFIAMRRLGHRVLILEGLDPRTWWSDAEDVWDATVDEPGPISRQAVQAPPPPARADLGLGRSFFLERRKLELRVGWSLDGQSAGLREVHVRWGLRPHLELSFPFVLSTRHQDAFGTTIVSAGLTNPSYVGGDKGLSVTRLMHNQLVGLALQLRTAASTRDIFVPERIRLFGGAALALRPCEWIQLTAGGGVSLIGEPLVGSPELRYELGSVLTRGLARQPLLEVKVADALHLFLTSVVEVSGDLKIVEQRHTGGVMVLF